MIAHKHFASLLIAALALGGATVSLSGCDNKLTKDKSAEQEEASDEKKDESEDKAKEEDKEKEQAMEGAGGAGGQAAVADSAGDTTKPKAVAAQPMPTSSILRPDLTAQPRPTSPTAVGSAPSPQVAASAITSAVRKKFPRFKLKIPPVPPPK